MSSVARKLETERLILRRWRDEDLDALAAMNADPEVMRFIGDGHVHERAEAAKMLEGLREHWNEYGFGRWAIERRDDGAVVGFVGAAFPLFAKDFATIPEIGWRLARPAWGHGFATEAAAAARDDFFASTGFEQLISLAYPENVASLRVMEKLGLLRTGETFEYHGHVVWVHRLDRADWKAAA
jgi:RimJ/RimL family protein N-acetyltransferase